MRFIRARVANEADAEDVLQDVWHRLANALNAGPVEQVGAWLYTVAQNRIIDRYRKPAMPSERCKSAGHGSQAPTIATPTRIASLTVGCAPET